MPKDGNNSEIANKKMIQKKYCLLKRTAFSTTSPIKSAVLLAPPPLFSFLPLQTMERVKYPLDKHPHLHWSSNSSGTSPPLHLPPPLKVWKSFSEKKRLVTVNKNSAGQISYTCITNFMTHSICMGKLRWRFAVVMDELWRKCGSLDCKTVCCNYKSQISRHLEVHAKCH